MKRPRMMAACLLACSGFSSSLLFADSGGSFLKIDPSPRAYALGGANIASTKGAESIAVNPANLAPRDKRFEVMSAFSSLLGGAQYGYTSFAMGRPADGSRKIVDALGFSVTYFTIGGLEGRDKAGLKTGTSFSSRDQAFSMSASGKLSSSLRMGLTGKLIQSQIAGYKSNMALGSDIGLGYGLKLLSRPCELGLTLKNLGRGLKYLEQTDSLPSSLNAGLSMGLGPVTTSVGASRLHENGKMDVKFGAEFGMGPFSLRAGFKSGNALGSGTGAKGGAGAIIQGLSTGMGMAVGSLRLDYAIGQPVQELGLTHRAALAYQWGGGVAP